MEHKDKKRDSGSHQNKKKFYKNNKNHKNHNNHNNHKKEVVPAWDFERRGEVLHETKADLMMLLEDVNPEELMMVSLVKQNKDVKIIKKSDEETSEDSIENPIESLENPENTEEKVKISISKDCPICGKPIREIMYALHDYDHDQLAHFDCVYKKVLASAKEKLTGKRYLAYLGSGSFGIMDPNNGNKQRITLIEKIYPGAPLEELLHGDENIQDDEL